jgi:hypothetical protein
VAAAKTPPPVAVGSPPLSSFYMLLSIFNTYLCCAAVLPVFSPIIYVITYSDGLCHPTAAYRKELKQFDFDTAARPVDKINFIKAYIKAREAGLTEKKYSFGFRNCRKLAHQSL